MSGRILARRQFGDPILQTAARRLTVKEIKSPEIQELIENIRYTLLNKKLGVGLAAPQVGQSVALSVIDFKPKKHRPELETFSQVIINPEVVKGIGKKEGMWEGCLSFGAANSPVFAKAMRYKKVQVRFYDERAVLHEETLSGFAAHVFQHEADTFERNFVSEPGGRPYDVDEYERVQEKGSCETFEKVVLLLLQDKTNVT